MNEREIARRARPSENLPLDAADAAGAETVVDARALCAVGAIVSERGTATTASASVPALAAQHVLERREGEQYVVARGGIAHGADAPDPSLQRAERRADLDTEILDESSPHAQLVHAVGNDDRREEGES